MTRGLASVVALAFVAVGCSRGSGGSAPDDASVGGGFNFGGAGAFGGGGGAGGSGGGSCVPALPQLEGDYLFALSSSLAADNPFVLLNTVTANGSTLSFSLQPLMASDRTTPTGSPLSLPGITVDESGHFDADPAPFAIPPESNPVTGSPMTVDFTSLRGQLCPGAAFFCGDADGSVTSPIELSVNGSTFTMEKVEAGVYPEPPKIDCSGTLAKPLAP